jgi:multisubunit Na+/H+ antiporter MnhE subunit
MPRAAVASAALFAVWLLIHNRSFYRQGIVGQLFSFALALIFFTGFYYGFKGLRWLKRRVMWRVRRRLVITYLFVGLTPIVLLFTLAVIINFVGLSQVMTRVVKVQLADKENQSLANARTLAEAFLRLPQNGDKRAAQTWLDERVAMLQSSLPGARVAVWTNAADENSAAQFVSEPRDERVRPLGGDAVPLNSPLPDWLRGRDEWSGFAYLPPLATPQRPSACPPCALSCGRARAIERWLYCSCCLSAASSSSSCAGTQTSTSSLSFSEPTSPL